MSEPEEEKTFTITDIRHGYNHDAIQGTYTGSVTVEDVKKRFYHEYFGGRSAWAKDGQFGCIIHND